MVDVSDFGLVGGVAIEEELPYSVVGYIQGDCNSYVPPAGYVVTSCDTVGYPLDVGGKTYPNLSKISISEIGMANTRTFLFIGGGILVLALGVGALWAKSNAGKKKRRRT